MSRPATQRTACRAERLTTVRNYYFDSCLRFMDKRWSRFLLLFPFRKGRYA